MSDLARLERDGLPLSLTRLDIAQVLRDVDAYLPDATVRHVKLILEAATAPLWIRGDEQRLLQVFSNVLDNAIKFTSADGSILVTLERYTETLAVRMRDTGHGISQESLPNVFDLYATTKAPRGMGIGLTVAKSIIELHGGSITVSSEGIDRGTEVIITLPVAAANGDQLTSGPHRIRA